MSTSKNKHLESVTAKSLVDWAKNDAFIMYASSSGIRLGVDGTGMYAVQQTVKNIKETHFFSDPEWAIDKYRELIK